MKKMKWFYLVLCVCTICAGCSGKSVGNAGKEETEETASMENAEYDFPEKYEKTSDSGKVKFNCQLEIPENMKQEIHVASVEGLYCCDKEKAWAMFGEGKEVIEKPEIPADEGRVPYDYYMNIGVQDSNNQAVLEEDKVSFKSGEECITEIKNTMEELGYHPEDFVFGFYPLNFQTMKTLEEEYIQENYLEEDQQKENWSQEDDAYFIYAYQQNEGIPIFHELMSIAGIMAYDTPDNAPVQAVYSAGR